MGRRKRKRGPAAASPPGDATASVRRPPLRRRRAAATLAIAAALLLIGWLGFARYRGAEARPNVLLVTVDTLRADHVGCYGDAGAQTPTLDGLAAGGVRFAVAVAHAPLTAPSHASILTGLVPVRHGVRDNGGFALPEQVPTLAEAFRKAGYRTAAFVSGFPLDHRYGLARGFDLYDDHFPNGDDPRRAPYVERPADQTTDAILRWMEGQTAQAKAGAQGASWFAWLHYFDPHAPYEAPGEWAAHFAGRPYDGEIAFVDSQLGRLLGWLDEHGQRSRTLVLVTADHGESLGEHGEQTHGVFIYDATLRVPWIMAGPGVPAAGVARTVGRGIDVAPTLLDYARIPTPGSLDGRSLRPAVAGGSMSDEPAYAECLFASLHLGWAPLHALRTAQWKLVDAPRPELYALAEDSSESRDRFDERSDVAQALTRQLGSILSLKPPEAWIDAGSDAAERLRALGYLGSGQAPKSASPRRDPKDAIGLLNQLERGLAEARSNPALAIRELSSVLRQDPSMELALRYRAIAFQAAGRQEESVADIRAIESRGPLSTDDLVLLAESLRLAGRFDDALAALDRAAQHGTRTPEPLLIRGRVLRAMGRTRDAAAAFESVLSLAPSHAEALRGLAETALQDGDLAGAATSFERILAADPHDGGALLKLGVVRIRSGRLDEALRLFQAAAQRLPASAEAQLALAGAFAKSGRPAEAVPHFERAIELGGRTTVALNGLGFARLEAGDPAGALRALRESLTLDGRQRPVADVVARLARGERP